MPRGEGLDHELTESIVRTVIKDFGTYETGRIREGRVLDIKKRWFLLEK